MDQHLQKNKSLHTFYINVWRPQGIKTTKPFLFIFLFFLLSLSRVFSLFLLFCFCFLPKSPTLSLEFLIDPLTLSSLSLLKTRKASLSILKHDLCLKVLCCSCLFLKFSSRLALQKMNAYGSWLKGLMLCVGWFSGS